MAQGNHLLFTLALAVWLCAAWAEDCHMQSPCLCTYSDGTEINLSLLAKNNPKQYLQASEGNYTFFYHGCTDVKFYELNVTYTNISRNTCTYHDANLCFWNVTDRTMETISQSSNTTFSTNVQNPHVPQIVSSGSFPTVLSLVCTATFFDDHMIVENTNSTPFKIVVYSPHACRTNQPHYLSTGTKLLIMLFTFGLVYLIGGAALAYFIKGARGRELIPNVDFWTSLPGLVKDGCIFVMGGCTSRMVSTAETYDQI